MSSRWRNILLALSFVASCGVHAWLIVPGLLRAMEGRVDEPQLIPASFESPPVVERLNETPLGIDAPTDPSTFTWVGHEEYQEHLAQQSEVEQAAFSSDAGNPGMPVQPSPPVAEPVEPSPEPVEPVEEQPEAPEEEEQAPEEESPEQQMPESLSPLKPGGDVVAAAQAMFADIVRYGAKSAKDATPTSPKPPEEAPKPATDTKPKPTEQPKPPAPQPSPDTPSTTPGTPEATPGEPAEKDSEATSTIDVPLDDIKLGKPVARPGLEIKPRRPEFTTLTRLTASPRNPLVELRFDRKGEPSLCRIVESSGDSRIDAPLKSSLYRWRARGKQIKALKGEETVNVQIRILLR